MKNSILIFLFVFMMSVGGFLVWYFLFRNSDTTSTTEEPKGQDFSGLTIKNNPEKMLEETSPLGQYIINLQIGKIKSKPDWLAGTIEKAKEEFGENYTKAQFEDKLKRAAIWWLENQEGYTFFSPTNRLAKI